MSPPDAPLLSDAAYLENLTRKVFISGFAWQPVRDRWAHFKEVFYGFDPETVADMPEPLVEYLCKDPGLIRNPRKIRATVRNAQTFVRIAAEHGSFWKYLRSLDGLTYQKRSHMIARLFHATGPNTVYYFLLDAGEPVPEDKPEGVR